MPLYEYQCQACGARFERIRRFSDPPLTTCPNCGAEQVEKLVSSPAFQFKGSGWYITDYARKSGEGSSTGGTKPAGESKADETKTDSKSEAATDSKADTKSSGPAPAADKPAAPASAPKDKS